MRQPTKMEERCARAYCRAMGVDPDSDWRDQGNGLTLDYHDPDPRWWVHALHRVRAVIDAMRVPNKSMAIAGDDELQDCMDSSYSSDADGNRYEYQSLMPGSATRTWKAMIDEASPPEQQNVKA